MRACLALIASLATAAIASPADPLLDRPWQAVSSAHFTMMTDLPQDQARSRLRELELFRAVILRLTGSGDVAEPVPNELWVFARHGDYAAVHPGNQTIGYAHPGLRANRMVASADHQFAAGMSVILHEYVHHLVSTSGVAYLPTWYSEGVAEVFSTLAVRDDKVLIGISNDARVRSLADANNHLSLRAMVTTDDLDQLPTAKVGIFYAKAWALTHFLWFGHLLDGTDRNPALREYLARVGRGEPGATAFEAAFGMPLAEMDRAVGRYLTRRNRPVPGLPAAAFGVDPAMAARPLARSEVANRLGYAIVDLNPALAGALFDAWLAEEPGSPRALAGRAVAHQFAGEHAQGADLLARAVALAPEDPLVALELADLLMSWCRVHDRARRPADCEARMQQAAATHLRLLEGQPGSIELMGAAADSLLATGGDPVRAGDLAGAVLKAAPWHHAAALVLGTALVEQARFAEAETALRRVVWHAKSRGLRRQAQAVLDRIGERGGAPVPEPAAPPPDQVFSENGVKSVPRS